jgi:uncharacterized protein
VVIVISNTSPITNLAAIRQFDLLRYLYRRLFIAEAVWDELGTFGRSWPGRSEVASATWIERREVRNVPVVEALRGDLDRGEAETIALALELSADLVLMDEREGRHAAQRLGLRTVGVVGILLDAKRQGHLAELRPHLDALREAGFYLSQPVYRRGLELAGEPEPD